MINSLSKLLFVLFSTIHFFSYATTDETIDPYAINNKFDTSITEFPDGLATYVIYFGEKSGNRNLKNQAPASQENRNARPPQQPLQKRIFSHRTDILTRLKPKDYQLIRSFKSIPAMVIRASESSIKELAKSPLVQKIGLDIGGGRGHLEDAIPQSNIDLVKAIPLTGEGVEVAIIDSGLDENHPDFGDRVISQSCFASDCDISIYDQNGHGTNVAGIIAGAGTVAPQGGAPNVRLHILKILDANNNFDSSSQVVQALDHIINELPNVSIVNMSIGTSTLFDSVCDESRSWTQSMAAAVNQLNAKGVTLFASAGNEGSSSEITAPACLSNVIAVGATWDNQISSYSGFCSEQSPVAGELTCFSNSNDDVDIVAPGALITATGRNHGVSHYAGTSMASPLVASCAVLLHQANPNLTSLELRTALIEHGGVMINDSQGRSFPSLDCWQAYQSIITDENPILTRVLPQSPHTTTASELEFSATAQDNEDCDLTDQITWWIDNIDTGSIGGKFKNTFTLGDYTVTAKVLDSSSNEMQIEWQLSIVAEPSSAPVILISSPANNGQFNSGQSISFTATATDQEDGDISTNIQWLYGGELIDQGASFSKVFTSGSHTVTASIADTDKNVAQADISFTVTEPAIIEPPSTGSSSGGGSIGVTLLSLVFIRLMHRPRKIN